MRKKPKRSIPDTRLILDAHPSVLRAHTIADTIRAVAQHTDWMPQNAERDAIAEDLGVPALWIHAATERDTVTLDLLHEWREWHEGLVKHVDEKGGE